MSSDAVNDENRGICSGRKHGGSETTAADIFALDQPTGRPSILRQSQTENLPSKGGPKGVKVCFQTPRRDPFTKRLVSPAKDPTMTSLEYCTEALQALRLACAERASSEEINGTASLDRPKSDFKTPYPDDDMPIQSKGGYQLDFENLDLMNPFSGASQPAPSPTQPPLLKLDAMEHVEADALSNASPESSAMTVTADSGLDDTLPFCLSVENSMADTSAEVRSTDCMVTPRSRSLEVEAGEVPDDQEQLPAPSPSLNQEATPDNQTSSPAVKDPTPSTKGSYSFEYDDLDSINPFQTGGSKIPNSPIPKKSLPCSDPLSPEEGGPEPTLKEKEVVNAIQISQPAQAALPLPEVPPPAEESPSSTEPSRPAADAGGQSSVSSAKEGALKLEFNFDDGEVKRKPPPKRFGKRPPSAKVAQQKAESEEKGAAPSRETPCPKKPAVEPPSDVAVTKGSYSFDFDKFDDPNFDPFNTGAKMSTLLASRVKSSPEGKMAVAVPEATPLEDGPVPAKSESSTRELPNTEKPDVHKTAETQQVEGREENSSVSETQGQISRPKPSRLAPRTPEPVLLSEANDEFVPATMFMSGDFEGQMDYLEQFGSSTFKESALRKQSLYLKFDPLLRDSPTKSSSFPAWKSHPAPLDVRSEAQKTRDQEETGEAAGLYVADLTEFGPLGPPYPPPLLSDNAIIDVLLYSQKDMDEALAKVQKEAKEKDEVWEAKYDKLCRDNHEMGKIMSEFEATVAQIMVDRQQERETAQATLTKALQEKEQLSSELNSLERSFSDHYKRLDKYKEVIEGYKKNEEMLKKCAQDYLNRIRKEEQRYQMLKAHAEEKMELANGEIAEVRSKMKVEVSTLQAQLRREQLKVQSLEKSLDQKVKEAEDLTKLCDELIANVQKR